MYDTEKAVLRGKLITLSSFISKKERSKIHTLSLYLRKLEKENNINLTQEEEKK